MADNGRAARSLAVAALVATVVVTIRWAMPWRLGGDAQDYIDAARDLSGPTRFPLGFPLLLSPFSVGGMQVLAVLIAVALVVSVWWAAVRLGGWWAGIAAGGFLLTSPGITSNAAAIMSDRLGALLVVGGLLAVLYDRDRLAGVLVALSGWVRLAHVAFVVLLPRRAWPAGGAVVAALAVWQLVVQGSVTGYDAGQASFGLGYIFGGTWYEWIGNPSEHPNIVYFPGVLLGLTDTLLTPFMVVPAVFGLRHFRGKGARFAALLVAGNLAIYLPYYHQSPRFLLPAGCLLIVYASAAIGAAIQGVTMEKSSQRVAVDTPAPGVETVSP